MFKKLVLMSLLVIGSHNHAMVPAIGTAAGALGGAAYPLMTVQSFNDAGQALLFKGIVAGMLSGSLAGVFSEVVVQPSFKKPVAGSIGFLMGLTVSVFLDAVSQIKVFPA